MGAHYRPGDGNVSRLAKLCCGNLEARRFDWDQRARGSLAIARLGDAEAGATGGHHGERELRATVRRCGVAPVAAQRRACGPRAHALAHPRGALRPGRHHWRRHLRADRGRRRARRHARPGGLRDRGRADGADGGLVRRACGAHAGGSRRGGLRACGVPVGPPGDAGGAIGDRHCHRLGSRHQRRQRGLCRRVPAAPRVGAHHARGAGHGGDCGVGHQGVRRICRRHDGDRGRRAAAADRGGRLVGAGSRRRACPRRCRRSAIPQWQRGSRRPPCSRCSPFSASRGSSTSPRRCASPSAPAACHLHHAAADDRPLRAGGVGGARRRAGGGACRIEGAAGTCVRTADGCIAASP